MNWAKPVIIVGAPRSGTSLLHQILRGHPGFASVANEASVIWECYTHPSIHAWRGECAPIAVSDADVAEVRRLFQKNALPAWVWRRLDARQVASYQRVKGISNILRIGHHASLMLLRMMGGLRSARLVEKSVHNALWLGLVDRVFPDALYLHITRNPAETIDSIARGWLEPRRFETYRLPATLRLQGCDTNSWNFPLPVGWERFIDKHVCDVAAFQWDASQRKILEFAEGLSEQRYLRVRLEDIAGAPQDSLRKIADFIGVEYHAYLSHWTEEVPKVNAGKRDQLRCSPDRLAEAVTSVQDTALRLGYRFNSR